MLFKDVVGQGELKQRLIRSVQENRISHAQLFLGPEGSGNLALAIAYAQYICCTNKSNEDSCGECGSCVKYQKIIHPDLHFSFPTINRNKVTRCSEFMVEWRAAILNNPYLNVNQWLTALEAENKQGNITVDECHDIIKKLSLKSFESEYKILIMWMPEYLGNAGNTLLKIIEEPPQKTLFLLVAENSGQIINTVNSRSQLIKIHKIKDQDILQSLIEKHHINKEKAENLTQIANGDYNLVLSMLNEDNSESAFATDFLNWMRFAYGLRKGMLKLQEWVEEMARSGRERQKNFLQYGLHIVRESMIMNYGDPSLVRLYGKEYEDFKRFSPFITNVNAEQIFELLNDAIYHIERNANPRILFVDCTLKLASLLKLAQVEPQVKN